MAVLAGAWRTWVALTRPVGHVIGVLTLVLLFFLVVVPMGWLARVAGLVFMPLRPDPSRETYWIERGERPPIDRYGAPY